VPHTAKRSSEKKTKKGDDHFSCLYHYSRLLIKLADVDFWAPCCRLKSVLGEALLVEGLSGNLDPVLQALFKKEGLGQIDELGTVILY
jgi:hypothetical protein